MSKLRSHFAPTEAKSRNRNEIFESWVYLHRGDGEIYSSKI